MSTDQYLGITEAADHLGVSRYTMWRLVRKGEIPTFVSPLNRRKKLVRRDDVEQLKLPVPVHEAGKVQKDRENT
jgi:excisionase family DNA binding protein